MVFDENHLSSVHKKWRGLIKGVRKIRDSEKEKALEAVVKKTPT